MRFTFLERGDPAEVRPIILSVLLFLLRRSSWISLLEVVERIQGVCELWWSLECMIVVIFEEHAPIQMRIAFHYFVLVALRMSGHLEVVDKKNLENMR